MNHEHTDAAQAQALDRLLAARTSTPIAPARLLYRPAAAPKSRWELHLPNGAAYPRATFADGFSALAAHAPGLDLAMSPTATAAAVAELANVTRLAHIANSPHRAALIARPAEDREYYSENVADTLGDADAEALGYGSDDPELSAAWAAECEAAAREAEASE